MLFNTYYINRFTDYTMINICKVPFVNSQESRDRSFKLYKIKFVKHSD